MSSAPSAASASPESETCARCERVLTADDRVAGGGKTFCRSCYETLRQQLESTILQMSTDIPYPAAALGAVLGGAAGALLWWGVTAGTHIPVGPGARGSRLPPRPGARRLPRGQRSQ